MDQISDTLISHGVQCLQSTVSTTCVKWYEYIPVTAGDIVKQSDQTELLEMSIQLA